MAYLVDTNLLLRGVEPTHPMFSDAVSATSKLLERGEKLYITPQNLIEFWNVCTRPSARNGLGRTLEETETEVNRLKRIFRIIFDNEAVYKEWERLVTTYGVKGVNVHDAHLVASMIVHRLTHILTFNMEDFNRYSTEITPVHPTSLILS